MILEYFVTKERVTHMECNACYKLTHTIWTFLDDSFWLCPDCMLILAKEIQNKANIGELR